MFVQKRASVWIFLHHPKVFLVLLCLQDNVTQKSVSARKFSFACPVSALDRSTWLDPEVGNILNFSSVDDKESSFDCAQLKLQFERCPSFRFPCVLKTSTSAEHERNLMTEVFRSNVFVTKRLDECEEKPQIST